MSETFPTKFFSLLCLTTSIFVFELFSQNGNPGRRPPMREHTITTSGELKLIPSGDKLPFKSLTKFKKSKSELTVESNAIPEHKVGAFPSRGNPNKIREQALKFTLPLNPTPAKEPIPLHNESGRGPPNTPFGIALNGVLFDPGTAEFYMGDRLADWNYEALGGAVLLGLDENHGHVQPNGSYHYHGLPTAFLNKPPKAFADDRVCHGRISHLRSLWIQGSGGFEVGHQETDQQFSIEERSPPEPLTYS